MKRVLLAADGLTVADVIVLPDVPAEALPAGIDVDDLAYVGPGMVLQSDSEAPCFAWPQ